VATEVPVGGADVSTDADGNFYITDEGYPGIFKVGADGILTVLAGTGEDGYSGEGGPATEAKLSEPTTVAVGPDGNLYVSDWGNNRIRMVVLEQ
jgi:serine/threonine-protein kinase